MSRVESGFCRSGPWAMFARRTVLPWALHHEQLSGRVLELGGGGGAMAEQLVQAHPKITLTSTDLDPAMQRAADRRLAHHANATAEFADATALPYPDDTFDVVLSFLMLHHVIAWEDAVAEAMRVLRPGGRFIGYDLLDTPVADWTHRIDRSPYRLIKRAELEAVLTGLGAPDARVDHAWRGHVIRFDAVGGG